MTDTTEQMMALVSARHQRMTALQRWEICSAMFDTARRIVDSSLPAGLTEHQRRLLLAKRLYGVELPSAALVAFADRGS